MEFDYFALAGHDYGEVDLCLLVFGVGQVEEEFTSNETYAHGCHLAGQRCRLADHTRLDEGTAGHIEGYAGTVDGSGASPAVGLEDVAVDVDGALAESGAVGYSSEAAAYQALNFGGAASHCRFALGTGERGAGQHGIFGGDPADASTAQEGRNALLHRCGADDSGHAHLHEGRTFGESLVTGLQIQGANFVVGASVSPH